MAAGTQVGAFHPLVAFADTERAVEALHGATVAIEGDDQLAAMLADMAEAIGARAGPTGARLEGRLPCRRGAGRRRVRRPARCDRGAGSRGRARRGRLARDLRPAHRGDAGQRPRARHPCGADRPDDPRRRRDARRRTSTRFGARPGRRSTCTSLPPIARSIWPRRARRAGTGGRDEDACRARGGLATPGPNRYHSPPWITASRPSTRPARRPDSSARRPASGNDAWASARRARSTRRVARPRSCTARRSRRSRGCAPAGAPSTQPSRRRRSGRPRPLVTIEWARSGRPGTRPPPGRRVGAVARLRSSTATSAGGIVVRYESGRRGSSSAAAAASVTAVPGRSPRARPTSGESREETAMREVEEETGLKVRITGPARVDRILVRPVRHADPQDRPLLPDGARPAATWRGTTTSSTRSAGSPFDDAPHRC